MLGKRWLKSVMRGEQMLRGRRVGEEMVKERHAGGIDVERTSFGEKLGEGKDGGGKCGLYIWGFGSKIS